MEDFDKTIEEVFKDRYKDVCSAVVGHKIKATKDNIDKLAKLALLSSEVMDAANAISVSHYSDLSGDIETLLDQVKLYKKTIFHIKLDKEKDSD